MANPTPENINGIEERPNDSDEPSLVHNSNNGTEKSTIQHIDDVHEQSSVTEIQKEPEDVTVEQDLPITETSITESEGADADVGMSPKKTLTSTSDSESDTSSDSKIPKKRRKKNNGNYAVLKHHQTLKKTLTPFIQNKDCEKLKYNLGKCLECRNKTPKIGRKGKDGVCRFLAFRKLRYTERGSMTVAGFPDSACDTDYTIDDLNLWTPHVPPEGTTFEMAKFLLKEVGDQFCDLVKQEKTTLIQLNDQENRMVTWRRVVLNLRELCDVCSTTLFNYHWTCRKCGFVVCVSCFNSRKGIGSDKLIPPPHVGENKDEFGWLKCTSKAEHKLEQLMLTQIVAGKAIDDLWTKLHQLRKTLMIPENCGCTNSDHVPFMISKKKPNLNSSKEQINNIAPTKADASKNEESDEDIDDQDGLMDLFAPSSNEESEEEGKKESDVVLDANKSVLGPKQTESASLNSNDRIHVNASNNGELQNFIRRGVSSAYTIKVVPKQLLTLTQSQRLFPDVPHEWFCSGYLLRLTDPSNSGNLHMFQDQWKRGQPVIVSNVGTKLDKNLWAPEAFSRDFGQKTNNLINCMTGKVVPNQKMKKFWDGFEHVKQRLRDDNGEPMLLKLKDWPPSDDFAKLLPERFKDLMNALPLGEYTHRDGKLNLAARLPNIFCKPDLGPKMYIAYGSGLHLDKGTTNLHLDVSDAVNVMVHVGVVKDDDTTAHDNAVMKAIEDSDCDKLTMNRVLKDKELPGALWHIWEAKDADKIRDMMNKAALEKGFKVERHHDAIHDQSWYLDSDLRKRLREDYNVIGYPILQCEGDAVFIPAGAPHQVRNLNNCIKVAEDFVSPENVGHCFYLTEEFRNLTETHTNHEDKLQIKNIVYHTVKDAVAVITAHLSKEGLS